MDLSIQLGKITLKNPLICASSEFTMTAAGIRAALDGGAAAVIAKSINESPRASAQLDTADYLLLDENWNIVPWDSGRFEQSSLFCRSGLVKTPLNEWLKSLSDLDSYAKTKDAYVAGSITVSEPGPAADIAAQMEAAGLRWIELNLSAPHGREAAGGAVRQITSAEVVREYVRPVREAIGLPLAVKLTAQTEDPIALAKQAIDAGADMLVMIGRAPGFIPDIESYAPVLGSWGAIGGRWSLPTSLYWISKSWRALPRSVPIVGTNGARGAGDVIRFLLSGARAVEFASLILTKGPSVFTQMLEELHVYGARKKLNTLAELIGRAADAAAAYGSLSPIPWSSYPWDRFLKKSDD